MSVREYIGARYVPLFADPIEWDSTRSYEPLTVVQNAGNSYTSRQFVPVGVSIGNTDFWILTGNYNAQIEAYRQEVQAFDGRIDNAQDAADTAKSAAETASENAAAAQTAADTAATAAAAAQTTADAAATAASEAQSSIDNIPFVDFSKIGESSATHAYVVGISNAYGENISSMYNEAATGTYENDIMRYGIVNKDGVTLLPEFPSTHNAASSNNPMPSLLNMFSYLDRQNVSYTGDYQVFDPATTGLANAAVCSNATMLYLLGIPYKQSKFAGMPNIPSQYKASLPSDVTSRINDTLVQYAWNTREIAYNAVISGNYAAIDSPTNVNFLKPGDVLIQCNGSDNNYLWDASHCQNVVAVFPENNNYLAFESIDAVGGSVYGDWCINTQGGTQADTMSLVYRNIAGTQKAVVFRPSFDPSNKITEAYSASIEKNFDINNTPSLIYSITSNVNVPQRAYVTFELECDSLMNLFTLYPDLDRFRFEICDYSSGARDFIMTRMFYRRAQLATPGYMPSKIVIPGYSKNNCTNIRVYAQAYASSSNPISLTFTDAKMAIKAYTL